MIENFGGLALWLLFYILVGFVNRPLTQKLLPKLPDGGLIFSKILGVLLVSYSAWLLASLKILKFSQPSLLILLGLLVIVNYIVQKANGQPWSNFFRNKIILLEEGIFVAAFIFWSLVRAQNPDIHDLEKYMDFGFINSILRSEFLPPADIWLAGFTINYYYFGHFVTAAVIKVLQTPPEIGYNLMLANLFALTLAGAFSLGFNLFKATKLGQNPKMALWAGGLTATILTLLGNLQVVATLFNGIKNYWYPDATRFIPETIHEFPIYSFVVADLHGHLLDLPIVLTTLAFFFSVYRQPSLKLFQMIIGGFLLSLMYLTNAVDALIYFGLFALLTFWWLSWPEDHSASGDSVYQIAKKLLFYLSMTLLSFLLFSLPFQLTFKPFTQGIALVTERSPLWMLLTIWGFFLFFALSFLAFYRRQKNERERPDTFIFLLSLFALFLIIVPEIIYFKDIYTSQPRANTMFKFVYQAFVIFSLVSGYTIVRISTASHHHSPKKIFWLLVTLNLIEIMALYPYSAINSTYGWNLLKNFKGLDGLKYLQNIRPGDHAAIRFLNQKIKGQPVILEAVGESYTDAARISANTGLPTVLGWPVHEWLWRQGVEIIDQRRAEIETIYTSPDLAETERLLKRYRIKYVYLGDLEREKYPQINSEKFKRLGRPFYEAGGTTIFKIL